MKDIGNYNSFLHEYLEHISYEITGLFSSYLKMTKINEYGKFNPMGVQGETNDCLDLMALHFRNLYEFFCFPKKTGYVRASNYVTGFRGSANIRLINKANNQVSHFTKKRHELAQNYNTKSWEPNEVVKWTIKHLDEWRDSLQESYGTELDKRLLPIEPFLLWYKGEMAKGLV